MPKGAVRVVLCAVARSLPGHKCNVRCLDFSEVTPNSLLSGSNDSNAKVHTHSNHVVHTHTYNTHIHTHTLTSLARHWHLVPLT